MASQLVEVTRRDAAEPVSHFNVCGVLDGANRVSQGRVPGKSIEVNDLVNRRRKQLFF